MASPKDEVTRRLDSLPEAGRKFFRAAFGVASNVDQRRRAQILDQLISDFEQGRRDLNRADLKARTGLDENDAGSVISLFTLAIGLISETGASADDFIEAAKGIILDPPYEAVGMEVASLICAKRDQIKRTLAKAQLGHSVLPSLTGFQIAIDVRMRLENGAIVTKVPVAILHIDTDAVSQELWVQLSQADIEELLTKLRTAESDLAAVLKTLSEDQ